MPTAAGDRGAELEASFEDLLVQHGGEMTFEQVECQDLDQLWLPLEPSQHIGREAGWCVSLACDCFADVAAAPAESIAPACKL
jgi:hypothetical protein